MAGDDDVQLPDLEVIQRYSLAVRRATAPRDEVIAALQADLAWLTGRSRSAAAPAVRPAPRPAATPARTPAKSAPVAKPAARAAKKAATPAKAAGRGPASSAKKAPGKATRGRRA